jgi:O-methyltransferase
MFSRAIRNALRPYVPAPVLSARQYVLSLRRDLPLARRLPGANISLSQRRVLVSNMRLAQESIACKHTTAEMEEIVSAILALPAAVGGCLVEAGCFKGGSTAKLSLAAKAVNRKLFVFDSFAGLPPNDEPHDRSIFGEAIDFGKGSYTGLLEEVRANVRQFGALDVCEFVPGWFDETMPHFREPIAVAFIDVDLALSTKTCLQYLYPLLVPSGSLFSHDGHLPLCLEAIRDDHFWTNVVGCPRPHIPGLGDRKLLRIRKPLAPEEEAYAPLQHDAHQPFEYRTADRLDRKRANGRAG